MDRGVHVTQHAVERFAERVVACSPAEATAAILSHSKAIRVAAEFGARTVKLASEHRLVLEGLNVVTVLPARIIDPASGR
jgi:hypothetical protein